MDVGRTMTHGPRSRTTARQLVGLSLLSRCVLSAFAVAAMAVSGCRSPSATLSDASRPKYGVSDKDETRWTDFLRPRPRVDKVDEPTWEIADKEPDAEKVQLAYAKWMEQSGKPEVALATYETIVSSEPENLEAQLGLARLDVAGGRVDAARERLKGIIASKPRDTEALTTLATLEMDAGRLDTAADLLARAVESNPESKPTRYLLGIARARQGRLAEARQLFVATVGEAEAHHNIGMLLKDTRPAEAAAEFRQALAKKPALQASRAELEKLEAVVGGALPQIQPVSGQRRQ